MEIVCVNTIITIIAIGLLSEKLSIEFFLAKYYYILSICLNVYVRTSSITSIAPTDEYFTQIPYRILC